MHDTAHELLLLGMLRRAPLSPYDLDRAVRGHSPLYRTLRFGNVYHLVDRLVRGGYLSRRNAPAVRGPSKTKSVLHLSAKGEEYFLKMLHEVVKDTQASDPAFEVALVLLARLPRSKAIALLIERRSELQRQERVIGRLFGDLNERSNGGFLAGTHATARLKAEHLFIRDMLRLLRNPRWRADWTDAGA